MRGSAGNAMSPSVGQRAVSFGAGIALNVAALAMLIWVRGPPPVAGEAAGGSMVSISLSRAPRTASKVPLAVPKLRQQAVLAVPVSDQPTAAAASPTGNSQDCPIVEDVAKGIIADPVAVDAIIRAPAELRSVADAIVVWNAAWAPATEDLGSPLGPVRANVTATLQSAPDDCLSAIVTGPRLIAVPNGERTLILVFGSGDWSWKTLIEPGAGETFSAPGQAVVAGPDNSRYRTN